VKQSPRPTSISCAKCDLPRSVRPLHGADRSRFSLSVSSSVEDFLDVLENDDAEVDVAKLADMAQHGVPSEVRGAVWKYLLGAAHADKCTNAPRRLSLA
jgi:hypothetical protein